MVSYCSGRLTWTQLLMAVLVLSLLLMDGVDSGSGGRRRRRRNKRGGDKCSATSIAEYKLTFHGTWSKDKFPRMYPRYRPSAQWSKLVGRTHGPTYRMWTEGELADPALKRLAENSDSLLYDGQPQGYHGIFDSFYAEALTRGEGRTSTFIMADGAHSKVSFVVKLVPSPDWFVGVDGLDLCRRGRWRARAHVNLRPMDAGTDQGYTFTSPNWPSHPRERIYQITSSHPDHPASAFLYPEYKRLPRIAYVQVHRVAQYFRKGAASALKASPGVNLVVFPGTTTTTTITTTMTTTISSAPLNTTQTTAATRAALPNPQSTPVPKPDEEVTTGVRSDTDKAGYAAANTLLQAHRDHQRNPVTTATPSTVSPGSLAALSSTKHPAPGEARTSSSAAVEMGPEDEERLERGRGKPGIYQSDGAHLNVHVSQAQPATGSADQTVTNHQVAGEADKTASTALNSTGDEGKKLQAGQSSPLSAHLVSHDPPITERLIQREYSTPTHASNTLLSPSSAQPSLADRSSQHDGLVPASRLESGNSPATTHNKDTLTMLPALSLSQSEQAASRSRADDKMTPNSTEPSSSLSLRTLDEPQFPEISVEDPFEDTSPVDCQVEEWGPWSACSKTCGFGVRTRGRDVLHHSRHGGFACPVLSEDALCGSMRGCRRSFFSILNPVSRSKRPRRVRRRRHHHDRHHKRQ